MVYGLGFFLFEARLCGTQGFARLGVNDWRHCMATPATRTRLLLVNLEKSGFSQKLVFSIF